MLYGIARQEVYGLLESKGVEAAVKPRENSILETPSEARRKAVEDYRRPEEHNDRASCEGVHIQHAHKPISSKPAGEEKRR